MTTTRVRGVSVGRPGVLGSVGTISQAEHRVRHREALHDADQRGLARGHLAADSGWTSRRSRSEIGWIVGHLHEQTTGVGAGMARGSLEDSSLAHALRGVRGIGGHVARPALQHPVKAPAGAGAQLATLDQGHAEPSQGGIPVDRAAGHPAADDDQVNHVTHSLSRVIGARVISAGSLLPGRCGELPGGSGRRAGEPAAQPGCRDRRRVGSRLGQRHDSRLDGGVGTADRRPYGTKGFPRGRSARAVVRRRARRDRAPRRSEWRCTGGTGRRRRRALGTSSPRAWVGAPAVARRRASRLSPRRDAGSVAAIWHGVGGPGRSSARRLTLRSLRGRVPAGAVGAEVTLRLATSLKNIDGPYSPKVGYDRAVADDLRFDVRRAPAQPPARCDRRRRTCRATSTCSCSTSRTRTCGRSSATVARRRTTTACSRRAQSSGRCTPRSIPSDGNYLALAGGSTFGIPLTDPLEVNSQYTIHAANIGDRIDAAGETWKDYQQSSAGPCDDTVHGFYWNDDLPMLYFADIRDRPAYCAAHDVPLASMASDLAPARDHAQFQLGRGQRLRRHGGLRRPRR